LCADKIYYELVLGRQTTLSGHGQGHVTRIFYFFAQSYLWYRWSYRHFKFRENAYRGVLVHA